MTEDEKRIHDWLLRASGRVKRERGISMRFIARDIALGRHRHDPRYDEQQGGKAPGTPITRD